MASSAIIDFADGIENQHYNYLTNFTATIETSEYGVFSNKEDIERFFNNSDYSFIGYIDDRVAFELNNNNSSWEVELSGFIEVVSSKDSLSIDFTTLSEISSTYIMLRNPITWDVMQLHQSNNVSDQNFFQFEDGNLLNSVSAQHVYDNNYKFSTVSVTEPETIILLSLSVCGLLYRKKKWSK